ncbi:hypothetical protein FA13DRAFT_199958 [Coprinellus micaceus]|uniref:Uncharacterized protein n=1 Tax=Coprinellus micaceus TaxID=71717 RepID=A0A4Y7SGL3_COPMI|nr:hypothetical protein FA13DRAFT_199958 [Coprinellus micaceus]
MRYQASPKAPPPQRDAASLVQAVQHTAKARYSKSRRLRRVRQSSALLCVGDEGGAVSLYVVSRKRREEKSARDCRSARRVGGLRRGGERSKTLSRSKRVCDLEDKVLICTIWTPRYESVESRSVTERYGKRPDMPAERIPDRRAKKGTETTSTRGGQPERLPRQDVLSRLNEGRSTQRTFAEFPQGVFHASRR